MGELGQEPILPSRAPEGSWAGLRLPGGPGGCELREKVVTLAKLSGFQSFSSHRSSAGECC